MLKFLAPGQEKLVQITEGHMKDHSNDGLRTLVLAKRNIDQARHASLLPGLSPRVTSASLVCKVILCFIVKHARCALGDSRATSVGMRSSFKRVALRLSWRRRIVRSPTRSTG